MIQNKPAVLYWTAVERETRKHYHAASLLASVEGKAYQPLWHAKSAYV
jgi:hypothetical protein